MTMKVATVVVEPIAICDNCPGSLEQKDAAKASKNAQIRKKSKTRPAMIHLSRTLD